MTKKSSTHPHTSLQGKVLISNKSLDGTYFEKTAIYICSHDKDGALGVIINKVEATYNKLDLKNHFPAISKIIASDSSLPVHFGGPMDEENYYILFDDESILKKSKSLSLLDNPELFLKDHFNHINHSPFLLLKGFCSWGIQQLEEEVRENSWLITTIDDEAIFNDKRKKTLWNHAIKKLGISDFNNLVNYSGNA